MRSWRTPETARKFKEYRSNVDEDSECALCKKSASEEVIRFDKWRIIMNVFPYDAVAEVHHMVVPLRHVKEQDLTDEEKKELSQLKTSHFPKHYDMALEALGSRKSVPEHFHLHLVTIKSPSENS